MTPNMTPLRFRNVLKILFFCSITLAYSWCVAEPVRELTLQSIASNPNALYAFFKAMPKAGELHYHLAGGAYPEYMLAVASQGQYCADPSTKTISFGKDCQRKSASALLEDNVLYDAFVRSWSFKHFIPTSQDNGHDHFFASFRQFMPIVDNDSAKLLVDILERAALQHELYLEVMVLPDNAESTTLLPDTLKKAPLAEQFHYLEKDANTRALLMKTRARLKQEWKTARSILGCDKAPTLAACRIHLRFQYYVLREQKPETLVSQAFFGFALARQEPLVVGVNLVQPEDGLLSLAYYKEHMRIFAALKKHHPDVKLSLHAGELNGHDVPPKDAAYHIRMALRTAKADRIGHGVGIARETKALDTLAYMKTRHIPVEINLSSNKAILDISGAEHPLRWYLKHGIPVVLSTDDEGILRTSLTEQFVLAVLEHKLDYAELKAMNRNVLHYAFLPGQSIWQNPNENKPIAVCTSFTSTDCQKLAGQSEKARLQLQLETQLEEFEKRHNNMLSKAF